MSQMLNIINDVREAVKQERDWCHDKITEITKEYIYHEWFHTDTDNYQLIININEIIRELFYENMTYYDNEECNDISVDMSDCYLADYMENIEYIIEDTLWNCTEENRIHINEPWLAQIKPSNILIINIDNIAQLMADDVERMMQNNEWEKLKTLKMSDSIKPYTHRINEIILEEFLDIADKYNFDIHGEEAMW